MPMSVMIARIQYKNDGSFSVTNKCRSKLEKAWRKVGLRVVGLFMARKAPPRRLELRSSAPEADTLSTELRGRATKFYHNAKPCKGSAPSKRFRECSAKPSQGY